MRHSYPHPTQQYHYPYSAYAVGILSDDELEAEIIKVVREQPTEYHAALVQLPILVGQFGFPKERAKHIINSVEVSSDQTSSERHQEALNYFVSQMEVIKQPLPRMSHSASTEKAEGKPFEQTTSDATEIQKASSQEETAASAKERHTSITGTDDSLNESNVENSLSSNHATDEIDPTGSRSLSNDELDLQLPSEPIVASRTDNSESEYQLEKNFRQHSDEHLSTLRAKLAEKSFRNKQIEAQQAAERKRKLFLFTTLFAITCGIVTAYILFELYSADKSQEGVNLADTTPISTSVNENSQPRNENGNLATTAAEKKNTQQRNEETAFNETNISKSDSAVFSEVITSKELFTEADSESHLIDEIGSSNSSKETLFSKVKNLIAPDNNQTEPSTAPTKTTETTPSSTETKQITELKKNGSELSQIEAADNPIKERTFESKTITETDIQMWYQNGIDLAGKFHIGPKEEPERALYYLELIKQEEPYHPLAAKLLVKIAEACRLWGEKILVENDDKERHRIYMLRAERYENEALTITKKNLKSSSS